jgi:hypothetical protein
VWGNGAVDWERRVEKPFVEGGTEEWWWQVSGRDYRNLNTPVLVRCDSMVGVVKRLKLKAVEYDSLPGLSKRVLSILSRQTSVLSLYSVQCVPVAVSVVMPPGFEANRSSPSSEWSYAFLHGVHRDGRFLGRDRRFGRTCRFHL